MCANPAADLVDGGEIGRGDPIDQDCETSLVGLAFARAVAVKEHPDEPLRREQLLRGGTDQRSDRIGAVAADLDRRVDRRHAHTRNQDGGARRHDGFIRTGRLEGTSPRAIGFHGDRLGEGRPVIATRRFDTEPSPIVGAGPCENRTVAIKRGHDFVVARREKHRKSTGAIDPHLRGRRDDAAPWPMGGECKNGRGLAAAANETHDLGASQTKGARKRVPCEGLLLVHGGDPTRRRHGVRHR